MGPRQGKLIIPTDDDSAYVGQGYDLTPILFSCNRFPRENAFADYLYPFKSLESMASYLNTHYTREYQHQLQQPLHYIGSNLNTTNSTYHTAMSYYAQSEASSEALSAASSGQAVRITWEGNQYLLQPSMRTYISGLINRCTNAMSMEQPPYRPYRAHLLCVPHGPRSSSTLFNLVSLTFTIAGLTYPQLRSTRQPQRRQKSLYFQNMGPKRSY